MDLKRTLDAIWRMESAKMIAVLMRMLRDIGLAEEIAQEAFVAALQQWPDTGLPDHPGAWLMALAKNRAIDLLRRNKTLHTKHAEIGRQLDSERNSPMTEIDKNLDDPVGDDLLRLIFTTCHPVLSTEARAALALRLLGGLTTEEIARAFLTAETTIAQRIVRAKKILAEKQIEFEVPRGQELADRLSSVLEIIYLIFNEGYTATAGADWMRPALCEEASRLGRILAALMPDESEVHGLVALMDIQASRLGARTDRAGQPILLFDQNRAKWDHILIRHGLEALARAEQLGGAKQIYALQAAIAACHARAKTAEETNWAKIAELYADLVSITPSPVIELNRAVAVAMAFGPQQGLVIVDRLKSAGELKNYHLLPSVRGDLLSKLGRNEEAVAEFEKAAGMTRNESEQRLLHVRASACRAAQ